MCNLFFFLRFAAEPWSRPRVCSQNLRCTGAAGRGAAELPAGLAVAACMDLCRYSINALSLTKCSIYLKVQVIFGYLVRVSILA